MHIIIGFIIAAAGLIWAGIQIVGFVLLACGFIAHVIAKARFLMNPPR